jgi:carbon-monoxide dehydrogenase medium subunit
MKPAPFDYIRPDSLDEALAILADLAARGEDVKLLAGGQSLMPLLNMRLARPRYLMDLNGLEGELGGPLGREGAAGILRLGALVRHHQLETEPAVARLVPVLREAARHIGHPAIRSRGTLGGSLVHADPAAELPVAAVLAEATLEVHSARGTRTVPARDFFLTYLTTVLEPDEIVTAVDWPVCPPRTGQALHEFARRHGDFALAMAAASVTLAPDGRIGQVRLVLGGVGGTPEDVSDVVAPLVGEPWNAARVDECVEALARGDRLHPDGDLHASAEYRVALARTLARRALDDAARRARAAAEEEGR